jgi:hypothetical protein
MAVTGTVKHISWGLEVDRPAALAQFERGAKCLILADARRVWSDARRRLRAFLRKPQLGARWS